MSGRGEEPAGLQPSAASTQSCKTRAQPLLGWTEQDQGLQANGVCNCQTIPLQSYQHRPLSPLLVPSPQGQC